MLSQDTRPAYESLLDAHALMARDDIAMTYLAPEPIAVSRMEFKEAVGRFANGYAKLGIQKRDVVLIAHTQSLESIYAFWGAMLCGAIPSMFPTLTEKLDPERYMASMAQLVKHADAKLVFTTDTFRMDLAAQVDCRVVGSSDFPIGEMQTFAPPDPDQIAFLQHSSGTTGLQKGVALTHRAVLNHLASYSDALQLNQQDVVVSWLPLYHDMGLIAGFLLPLMQGVPLVLMSPFDWVRSPAMLLRAIHEYRGTLCWLPNFAYNHCARRIRKRDSENLSLASMRAFINCSEPVYQDSHMAFYERFAANGIRLDQLGVSYAMAENTFAVTQTMIGEPVRLDRVDRQRLEGHQIAAADEAGQIIVSCGKAIPGTEARVVDAENNPLDERHIGEIAIRSDYMLSEYYHRPDLNADLFRAGWYPTGDMGYIADGEIFIIGRKKDLIISGGKNVYPGDLETLVNTIPGVHPGRAVAFGVYDEREGTELIAIVAEVDTDDPDEQHRIRQAIRATIANTTTVTASYVHLVGDKWLLKTSSGKIARAANRDKWLQEQSK